MLLALQPSAINAVEAGTGIRESAVNHVIDRIAEAWLIKSYALGKRAEQLNIGAALSPRRNGLVGHLQVVVPICALQVFVLEKRGRGQNEVGVVGSVGEELLVHHGEQIGTQQP